MTTEDRQLLLKDLCARLPYGIKCHEDDVEYPFDIIGTTANNEEFVFSDGYERSLEQIKPYLRPMSSMTEKEIEKFEEFIHILGEDENGDYTTGVLESEISDYVDWLNAHHFDYRGLIPMGLALEAPKDMYKN